MSAFLGKMIHEKHFLGSITKEVFMVFRSVFQFLSCLTISTILFGFSPASANSVYSSTAQLKSSMPIFPMKSWKDYIVAHDYSSMPEYLGFAPQYDQLTGQIKTSPLAQYEYGVSIPVVVRCNRFEGCNNYRIVVNGGDFTMEYKNGAAPFLNFRWNVSADRFGSGTTAINYITIPADSAGNKGAFQDIRKNYNDVYYSNKWYVYSGEKPSNPYALSTPYNGIVAILHLDQKALASSKVIMHFGNIPNNTGYDFPAQLITGNPYLVNGYVWKYIDSGFAGPSTSWSRSETVETGSSEELDVATAIEIGMKEVTGGGVVPAKNEISFRMTTTWGASWTSYTNQSSTTQMTCDNRNVLTTPLACGIYQLYGATTLNVPGITDTHVFSDFNNSIEANNAFTLSVGMNGGKVKTDDTSEILGTIYPVAGTLAPRESLNIAQPSLSLPESILKMLFVHK